MPITKTSVGRSNGRPCRWMKRFSTARAIGRAARTARAQKISIVADMTTMAVVVPTVSGRDHCHPMVSWDHMAMPKARKAARAQPSETTLARACSTGWRPWPARPVGTRRVRHPVTTTFVVRRHEVGSSSISEVSSSANSSP